MDSGGHKLPPMPPSDQNSIQKNVYEGFYRVRARDFWGENEVNYCEPMQNVQVCDHYFVPNSDGVKCRKCGTGFIGHFDISNGKLFHKGEPVGI